MTVSLHSSRGPAPAAFPIHPDLDGQGGSAPESELPDARLTLVDGSGCATAHAALWWRDTPHHDGMRVGAIGGFGAIDAAGAIIVLDAACAALRAEGCAVAVGPMNGNTWRRHRWVVESDGRGTFLLEPRQPATYPDWWRTAGFGELSRYSSSAMALDGTDTLPAPVAARLARGGVTVRPLDAVCYDEELRRIHAVSVRSFARNFLYTPLEEGDFLAMYGRLRDRVDPDFVKLAERDGEVCGFVFGILDWEAAARGEVPAVIVKTLAVDPAAASPGLGSLLVDALHRSAWRRGVREAIHALQHESNSSLRITSRHAGRVFRRYGLFSKSL